MKLIALILGLVIERLVTHLLHLRELHWFDRFFDTGVQQLQRLPPLWHFPGVLLILGIPALPVALVSIAFQDVFWDVPYLLFAVLVVLFSLGPRDLAEEVDEYCNAVTAEDAEAAERVAKELLEVKAESVAGKDIAEGIFIQANNRIFGVVFWFIVLGPLGAWLFRLSDLLRHRAVSQEQRQWQPMDWIMGIHGALNFIPARLAALGYAMGGSFDDAFACWRDYQPGAGDSLLQGNDQVVACVGCGAMGQAGEVPQRTDLAARSAMRLVSRTLFIWLTVLALMTIFGWAV